LEAQFVDDAPDAIGPYCHAMKVGNLLFCSGQTPLDPKTMELVGNNIEEQTERVFENLLIVLAASGLTLKNIVKTNVYLRDMAEFQGMNKIYAQKMGSHKPARTTIAVKQNPLDAMVEIECIAELNN
jgi:2-iminobutanoate/2-iminopropanoate deaminase